MVTLSPNAENLLRCLRYFNKQGYTVVEKKRLSTKPYDFSDQSMYELVRHNLISETLNTVSLI